MLLEEFLNELCAPLVSLCIFTSMLFFVLIICLILICASHIVRTKVLEDKNKTSDIVKQTVKEIKK